METSDSEYFESADEAFQSDDEDTNTVKSVTESDARNDIKSMNEATTQLKDIKLTEVEKKTEIPGVNDNKTIKNPPDENVEKDDENNVHMCNVRRKKDKQESMKKLGSKSAANDDSAKSKPEITGIVEVKLSQMTERKLSDISNTSSEKGEIVDRPPENIPAQTDGDDSELKIECKNEKKEENLWDDSEIDWGKEQEKEQEEEDNMWDNDDWESVEQPQQEKSPQKPEEKVPAVSNTTWGSWGTWGVSSILSTATQSVSTLTQGITTALETGMGVPEPEELARINHADQKSKETTPDNDNEKNSGFGLNNLVMGVSHLTKLVETTSTKVISGGLDTLETIGKKTMEVLQEGDPGLKKKRAFLKIDQDKPVLSQLLREAKEKAEHENEILEQKHFAKKAKNYETLFDDHQGLVHLEALEMLSKQCDIKLQSLLESYTDDSLTEMQETMDQVKELCELPDEDEDEQANWPEILDKLNSAVSEINVPITYKRLIETWEETETWLTNLKLEVCDERELHQQAVEALAQLTAIAVEQFHKAGELLLIKEHRSTADEADSLVQLTTSLTSLIGIVAAKFSDKLNAKSSNSENKETVNGLITNVFFEAANSSSYIQDAFQLLIPVLQVGAV